MSETVWLALLAAVMVVVNWYLRRVEKKEDWARQDEVAKTLKKTSSITDKKLDDIHAVAKTTHTLVNSDMTQALQSQLIALENSLYLMKKNRDWEQAQGDNETEASHAVITATAAQIQELKEVLGKRLEIQIAIDQGGGEV